MRACACAGQWSACARGGRKGDSPPSGIQPPARKNVGKHFSTCARRAESKLCRRGQRVVHRMGPDTDDNVRTLA